MSRYIEFTTNHSYAAFAGGGALHDGKLPNRFLEVRGVRVNGAVQEFTDHTIPGRLAAVIRQAAKLKHKIGYNCVHFASAMHDMPISNKNPYYNPYLHTTNQTVKPGETWCDPGMAVNLSDDSNGRPKYKTVVVPAYQPGENGAQYLHMLNHDGIVCLSGLQQAMEATKCNRAYLADIRRL